jgi:hypothetical protein
MSHVAYAIASAMPLAITLAAAITSGPDRNDMWASVGAALAVVFVLHDTFRKDRSPGHLFAVGLTTMFFGFVGPGVFVYYHFPEMGQRLTWHGWAALGLCFGLVGFPIGMAVHSLGPMIGKAIRKFFGSKLGIDDDNK